MRKILLAVMAVAAIGFTSCNNKANKDNPAIDSTSLVENMSPAELAGLDADNLIKDLTEKIAANNPEAVQAIPPASRANPVPRGCKPPKGV